MIKLEIKINSVMCRFETLKPYFILVNDFKKNIYVEGLKKPCDWPAGS